MALSTAARSRYRSSARPAPGEAGEAASGESTGNGVMLNRHRAAGERVRRRAHHHEKHAHRPPQRTEYSQSAALAALFLTAC